MEKTILSKCFLHGVLLTLAFCLFPVLPACAQEDIVDRLDKALGVTLPSEYKGKVKAFVQGSKVLEGIGAIPTEQFIKEQMKENWGINKQNQLLFIWDAIYELITKKNFYDGEDGNKQRLDDFEKVLDNIETCGKKYKQDYKAYMEQRSAEATQRSAEYKRQSAEATQRSAEYKRQTAEAQQRSAEAQQRSAEADRRSAEAVQTSNMLTYYGLYQITWFYQHRGAALESEKKKTEEVWKLVTNHCEKFNIDYRSLLPFDVQKFYGIQPTRQNNLTCEKAMAKILTCTLKEMAKLYNLYQQAPQAEREIDKKSANYIIADCKKRNIDYRAILLKELGDKKKVDDLLKLFGVE